MLWNRESRADGRQSSEWTERRRANYEARRARKRGTAIGAPFTNLEVFERDDWVCQLCSSPVDRALAWPDPESPSLDHVVALANGGAHSFDNVQLAHLRCNIQKGARKLEPI